MEPAPSSVLIIGAGVFGLSTAFALLKRSHYSNTYITIIDGAEAIPNPSGSSVDSSRIIRADYSNPIYARLAAEAQVLWRDQSDDGFGGQGRYFEPGFLLTMDSEHDTGYLRKCLPNVRQLAEETERELGGKAKKIEELDGKDKIIEASGYEHASGDWGYVNWGSGWGDAARVVEYMYKRVLKEGGDRVRFILGKRVERLVVEGEHVVGAQLQGEIVKADLVVLAAGAWSGALIDLRGRAVATGQALAYINIGAEEEKDMAERPTVINMSRGSFIIPPRYRELKVARHGYGYRNPTKVSASNILGCEEEGEVEVSLPRNGIEVPKEGQDACREALQELLPKMRERPWVHTRVCWYCDTPTGDFIIDRHPEYKGLHISTGGSGHGFKFAPVIGERIVDGIEGRLDPDLKESWKWPEPVADSDFTGCDDGSRSGPRGMILEDEMAKT